MVSYKLVATTDGRVRGMDGNKFDYKKGKVMEIEDAGAVRFYTLNGWKLVENTDASSEKVVLKEKAKRTISKKPATK